MTSVCRFLMVVFALPLFCAAVTIGQIDTFEDGTTEGWGVALGPGDGVHPAPPSNELGGIGGPLDHYLQLTALGGSGAGSRLAAMNTDQWSGNYIGEQIGGISMNVRNAGTTDLSLRLLFEKLGPMGPTDIAFSTNAIPLVADGGWTSIFFPISTVHLTAGMGDIGAVLRDTDVLRIFHNPDAAFPPQESIVASLQIDNIRTIAAIPEPSTVILVMSGFVLFAGRRLISRRSPENR